MCDAFIQFGKNPRNWCVFQSECRQGYCSGLPDAVFFGNHVGTQNEGCDYGLRSVGGNRECGSAQCSAGQVKSVCTLSSSTNNWDCDPTFSVQCKLTVSGKDYTCPCANASFCSQSVAQCTPL
jgi:hypothetical protein